MSEAAAGALVSGAVTDEYTTAWIMAIFTVVPKR